MLLHQLISTVRLINKWDNIAGCPTTERTKNNNISGDWFVAPNGNPYKRHWTLIYKLHSSAVPPLQLKPINYYHPLLITPQPPTTMQLRLASLVVLLPVIFAAPLPSSQGARNSAVGSTLGSIPAPAGGGGGGSGGLIGAVSGGGRRV
ncbi:hypothetical protein V500_02161 [Pseudogymnoascus sp. VKM F-4518 (FW-2643)]|nr:hypothetical protein V500_02161 [Pseudogymnoascus sp. VKM F-4518 (FW-2643)]